jgi:hypothetical protein
VGSVSFSIPSACGRQGVNLYVAALRTTVPRLCPNSAPPTGTAPLEPFSRTEKSLQVARFVLWRRAVPKLGRSAKPLCIGSNPIAASNSNLSSDPLGGPFREREHRGPHS